MIWKLVLRQIGKHWRGLSVILLIWIGAGYYIFNYQHQALTVLSGWFVSLPAPGTQDPAAAYKLVKAAEERLKQGHVGLWCRLVDSESCTAQRRQQGEIRLNMMQRACDKHRGRFKGEEAIYRPHWLVRLRTWNLNAARDPASVDPDDLPAPDEYWRKNQSLVLESLRDIVAALSYAYEIPPSVRDDKTKGTWLVAEMAAELSRALCLDTIGIMAWGDYIDFLELRAYNELRKELPRFEQQYIFPAEQELRALDKLRENPSYARALQEYAGASPPVGGIIAGCQRGPFKLVCVSPEETLKIYNKLLYILPARSRPGLPARVDYRLRLGTLYLFRVNRGESEFTGKALDNLHAATRWFATEKPARMEIARLHLKRKEYSRAFEQMRQLRLMGMKGREYRRVMRLTLMGMGRFADADCFSELADLAYGKRAHCARLDL